MARTKKRGITIREYTGGDKVISMTFVYEGERIDVVWPGAATPSNITIADKIRQKILIDIANDAFSFRHYPFLQDHPKAILFGQITNHQTIEDLIIEWLKMVKQTKPHSTYLTYRVCANRAILPGFGPLQLRHLTPGHIRAWVLERTGVCLKTIKNELLPLRQICETALNDRRIDYNPFDRLVIKRLVPETNWSTDYEVDPFEQDEIDAILAAAYKFHVEAGHYFQLAIYSGLRNPSEMMGLEPGDIDFRKRLAKIQRGVVMRKSKDPKTASSRRIIHLTDLAFDAIDRQLRHLKKTFGTTDKLFRRFSDQGRLYDYDHVRLPWKTILSNAGVRYRNPYQTRHTWASQMLENNEPITFVANQLGHKNTEMVIKIYGKHINKKKQTHEFAGTFGMTKRNEKATRKQKKL